MGSENYSVIMPEYSMKDIIDLVLYSGKKQRQNVCLTKLDLQLP